MKNCYFSLSIFISVTVITQLMIPLVRSSPIEINEELKDQDEGLRRPLQAGDVFTAKELLPISIKLLSKDFAKIPEGKGVVSSAKSPEELSDNLFQALFRTSSRLVTLRGFDVAVLDALQALALSGDPVKFTPETRRVSKYAYNASIGDRAMNPTKICKYTLLTKSANTKPAVRKLRKKGKGRLYKVRARKEPDVTNKPLDKYMVSFQNILRRVNEDLAGNDTKNMFTTAPIINLGLTELPPHTTRDPYNRHENANCRWYYFCTFNSGDIRDCQVRTQCDSENADATLDAIPFEHSEDEHKEHVKEFRNHIKITPLDEEVEKIIERVNIMIPKHHKQAEDVQEYFHQIMMVEGSSANTSPMPPHAHANTADPEYTWQVHKKIQQYKEMISKKQRTHGPKASS